MMSEPTTEKVYQTIGRNIHKFRLLQRLSQARLAEKSNVSAAYISQIECSRLHKGVTCTAVMKIAEALQVPTCVLLAEEVCPKYLQYLERTALFKNATN